MVFCCSKHSHPPQTAFSRQDDSWHFAVGSAEHFQGFGSKSPQHGRLWMRKRSFLGAHGKPLLVTLEPLIGLSKRLLSCFVITELPVGNGEDKTRFPSTEFLRGGCFQTSTKVAGTIECPAK